MGDIRSPMALEPAHFLSWDRAILSVPKYLILFGQSCEAAKQPMGHGLHSLCLQGQEAARLPLVPALLPVPSDLPHLLEGVKLLSEAGGWTDSLRHGALALRLPNSTQALLLSS